MDYKSATGYPDYEDFPSNHAPTYSDSPVDPLLAAIGGNMEMYANAEDRARYHNHMMNDGTHVHGVYASGGGGGTEWGGGPTGTDYSGYGYEPPSGAAGSYDYYPSAPVHVPAGGSYSHHATTGSGYGVPPPPKYLPHPPPTLSSKGKGKKKSSSSSKASTMNALTLLAFFFFVNLLQTCLKENMEAMNPTVMVMTTNVVSNRNTKLAEMNSREQSTSPASTFTSGANIVVQPEDLVSAAAVNPVAAAVPAVSNVKLQTSPYSDGGGGETTLSAASPGLIGSNNNNNYNNNNQGITHSDNRRPSYPQFSYGSNGTPNGQHQNNNPNSNNNHAYDDMPHDAEVPLSLTPTHSVVTANRFPRPDFHDSAYPYPNQTISGTHYHYHNQQSQRPPHSGPYEQESYGQQFPHHQHQHQYDQNNFEQHQHQQHHGSYAQDHWPQHQQSDPHDHHQIHHQESSPSDHFQHHYPAHHSLDHSPFHSHQHSQHSMNRHPFHQGGTHSESSHPWSYSPGVSSLNAHKRGSGASPLSSYTWSSSSRPSRVSGNSNFDDGNDDDDSRYEDSFYTRSNRKL